MHHLHALFSHRKYSGCFSILPCRLKETGFFWLVLSPEMSGACIYFDMGRGHGAFPFVSLALLSEQDEKSMTFASGICYIFQCLFATNKLWFLSNRELETLPDNYPTNKIQQVHPVKYLVHHRRVVCSLSSRNAALCHKKTQNHGDDVMQNVSQPHISNKSMFPK